MSENYKKYKQLKIHLNEMINEMEEKIVAYMESYKRDFSDVSYKCFKMYEILKRKGYMDEMPNKIIVPNDIQEKFIETYNPFDGKYDVVKKIGENKDD